MKNAFRLELLLRLGSKCVDCKESHYDVLQIDHIHGNGYLEREWFKINKLDMYETYLKNFDVERIFLEIRCANCNYKKKIKNNETRNRITLSKLCEIYDTSIDKITPDLLIEIVKKYPVLGQTMMRQLKTFHELSVQVLNERKYN